MAAVKSQEEQFSWLDNSFVSAAAKSVNVSHSAKRNRCSALPNGRRKSARLHCITQQDSVTSISVDQREQRSDVECNGKVFVNAMKQTSLSDADAHKSTQVIEQGCSLSDTCVSLSVDVSDKVNSFSEQDQSPSSLVFICVF